MGSTSTATSTSTTAVKVKAQVDVNRAMRLEAGPNPCPTPLESGIAESTTASIPERSVPHRAERAASPGSVRQRPVAQWFRGAARRPGC
jgi:hypothetical protein